MLRRRSWLSVLTIALICGGCASTAPTGSASPTVHVLSAITMTPDVAPTPTSTPAPTGTIVAIVTASPALSAPPAPPAAPTKLWRATMQTDSEFNIENPSALICHTQYKFVLDLSVGSA